ncbi:uncharacterized protein LOC129238727 [Anastrepha obliqua]|uniref:uncharacterized protein LOC129238727 n=1 Tax=Anastrepha obliqua TaxID=95512 RepID=UPI002409F232|nr:uncharacterized protein LOC129238727 [Anastrepha obliqua]
MTKNLVLTGAITVACVLLRDCFAQAIAVPLQSTALGTQSLKTVSALQSLHTPAAPLAKHAILAPVTVQSATATTSQGIHTFPSLQLQKLSPLPMIEPGSSLITAIATKKPSAALSPSAIGLFVPLRLTATMTQPPPVATPLPVAIPQNSSASTISSPELASATHTLDSNSVKSATFATLFSTDAPAMKMGTKPPLSHKTLLSIHEKKKFGKHPSYRFKSKHRSKATKNKMTAFEAYSKKRVRNSKEDSRTYFSPAVFVAPAPITYSPNSVKESTGLPPCGFIVIMRANGVLEPLLRLPLRQ